MSLLEIKDLEVQYVTEDATIRAVNKIDLTIDQGESLGLVGETGAGKTTTALAILGLTPTPPSKIVGGSILFNDEELLNAPVKRLREIRGGKISMIFQDPMTALNPVHTVGDQIVEVLLQHQHETKTEAEKRMIEILETVGIPGDRAGDYPHQFSGGMKQRIIIAIALACNPQLLIADEPTTALDVTIQAQVLDMIKDLQQKLNTSMLLITHDLGIVAETCNKVAIMYAGEIVECGSLEDIFDHAEHPYTRGLFAAVPRLDMATKRLKAIPGLMPDPANLPEGCKFHPRCEEKEDRCASECPALIEVSPGHFVRCRKCAERRTE